MSNLKQLRNRVRSIKSTQKITKAMQMVAASKFKRVKDQVDTALDYVAAVSQVTQSLTARHDLGDLSLVAQKFFAIETSQPKQTILLIVITSERGLCGNLNSSLIKKIKIDIAKFEKAGSRIKLIIVGRRGYEALKNRYPGYIDSYFNFLIGDNNNLADKIRQNLIEMTENDRVSSCYIYFNQFKTAMSQLPIGQCIMPVSRSQASDCEDYEYEGKDLVDQVINLYISSHINFALLQSKASEEGARMTAMDDATKNAKEIIARLTLELNRSRQATITKELIEIISGAEAI